MARKRPEMTEDDLIRILKQEDQDSAAFFESEVAQAQEYAMSRYHAEPYGDEVDGRSKVVTHDVEDTINWIMPQLMRAFAPSDEIVTVDDPGLEDGDDQLKQAADYLKHVWYKDNPGEVITHDYCFDALLQKIGIIRTYWVDPQPKPEKIVEGVTIEQLSRYVSDPDYEILEVEVEQKEAEGQPYECFNLRIQHTPKIGRVAIEAIPVEEFRVSRRARSVEDADYHAWKRPVFLSALKREFPDKARELDPDNDDSGANGDTASDYDTLTDARASARFPDEPYIGGDSGTASERGRKKVDQCIEYLRVDFDGDGVVELRRVNRVGSVILENDAMDESEFTVESPIRVAHRLIGRSLADTILDIQKIRTVLLRRGLDSLAASTMPRTIVSQDRMADDGSTLDDLLDHDIGGVIKVKGNVGDAITTVTMPDTSQSALTMIEYMDRRSEEATGVNRHAMGIQPQAITDTKGGIELLQAAANARVVQVARWLAMGLEKAMGKVLRLLIAHQDGPRMIKIAGKRVEMDPRRWSDEMTITVHVGKAGESSERTLMGLGMIAQKQEAIIMKEGINNPVCGVQEYRTTLAMMAEAMGHKNPGKFFKEIPPNYQPQPPGPDPKTAEVQGKMQMAQAEMQGKQQLAQAELQQRQQLQAAEFQHKTQTAQMQTEMDRETMAMKLQNEKELAMARMQSEQQLAVLRINAEIELAQWKAQQEFALRAQESAVRAEAIRKGGDAKTAKANGAASADGNLPDDRPGGRLDA
jgi:hypothetical protein